MKEIKTFRDLKPGDKFYQVIDVDFWEHTVISSGQISGSLFSIEADSKGNVFPVYLSQVDRTRFIDLYTDKEEARLKYFNNLSRTKVVLEDKLKSLESLKTEYETELSKVISRLESF